MNRRFLKNYSLFCLIFTLLTIFWGAWVRLSISGDACGKSWPLCDQGFFPQNLQAWIEWFHRLSSGLALVFISLLFILAVKTYTKNHPFRFFSFLSILFILVEALIGAILVLKGLVALNLQELRVLVLALHSINSILLVGALTLSYKTSLWKQSTQTLSEQLCFKKPLIYFVCGFPLLALTGNIASLAGQLFPSSSLASALALDLMPQAHISLKIRPLHPALACLFLMVLTSKAFTKKNLLAPTLAVFFVVLLGFATLLSLSPIILKLSHLVCAYMLWIFLVSKSVTHNKLT